MSHSTLPDCEPNSASTLPEQLACSSSGNTFLGALESLAECADPAWPHFEWHLYLLGFADLSTQARSEYGKHDVAADIGIWICAMCPTASLQQFRLMDLQHMSLGLGMLGWPAPALAMAYLLMLNGIV